jgi:hypothetical protein
MAHPLDSARFKLARAHSHFEELNREIDAFLVTPSYDVTSDEDLEGLWYIARLKVLAEPPDSLSPIAGDLCQNLRAALDHAVYALSTTKPEGTAFPIFSNEGDYRRSRGRNPSYRDVQLAGVPDTYRTVIDSVQPYNRGNQADWDYLAVLRWFTNFDKHRVLHAAFAKPRNIRIEYPPPVREMDIIPQGQTGPLDDGAELFRFRFLGPIEDEMSVQLKIDLVVGFGDRAIDAFDLRDLGHYVDDLVERLAGLAGDQSPPAGVTAANGGSPSPPDPSPEDV